MDYFTVKKYCNKIHHRLVSVFYSFVLGTTGKNNKYGCSLNIDVKHINIGKNISIGDNVSIQCQEIIIEDGAFIGNNCRIMGVGKVFIGSYAKLSENVYINGVQTASLTIGAHAWVGRQSILNATSDLVIGKNVGIGSDSKIFTHGFWFEEVDGFGANYKPVIIEDNSWLMLGVTVHPGSTIESRVMVQSGAVVIGILQKNSVYAGIPAIFKSQLIAPHISMDDKMRMIFARLNSVSSIKYKNFLTSQIYVMEIHKKKLNICFGKYHNQSSKEWQVFFVSEFKDKQLISTFGKNTVVIDLGEKLAYGGDKLVHFIITLLEDRVCRILPAGS